MGEVMGTLFHPHRDTSLRWCEDLRRLNLFTECSRRYPRLPSLKPYPAYKPSGVEWLGDVPTHWDMLPNRAIFAEVNERNHPDESMLSVTITKGVIHQRALLEDSSKKDASRFDRSDYKLARPSDIAYNKMRAWQGAIGASECFQGYVQVNGTGATFLGISQESIGNNKVCLPPYPEQSAIVKYLDEAAADIDAAIAHANHEIDLLLCESRADR